MKKLPILFFAGFFLLTAGSVFAQDESMTDEDFVSVTAPKKQNMDAFLGFRLGLTQDIKNEGELQVAPGVALGYNYWLQEVSESVSLGPVIRASLGFVSEVEVPVYSWSNGLQQVPGQSAKLTWGDNAILLNVDALAGYGLKFQLTDMFNLVAKGGLAFNADVAASSYSLFAYSVDITTGSMIVGLGFDAGIQIKPIKTMPLYVEIGAGLSFDFLGMLFSTIDITQNGESLLPDGPISDTGNFEPQSFLSIGAPYLVVGWQF